MTVNGNKRPIGAAILAVAVAAGIVTIGSRSDAADTVLKLRAAGAGSGAPSAPLSIELFRWSTDAERAPLVETLSAPPPPPEPAAPPSQAAGGRAGGRGGGRGGRAAGPPPSPMERLGTAIKAAPTVGFIWNDGPVGYSIKYSSKVAMPGGGERIVLVTDRRIGGDAAAAAGAAQADVPGVDFTVIEMRLDGKGSGEARMSTSGKIAADPATKMLALDGAATPVILKVTR